MERFEQKSKSFKEEHLTFGTSEATNIVDVQNIIKRAGALWAKLRPRLYQGPSKIWGT